MRKTLIATSLLSLGLMTASMATAQSCGEPDALPSSAVAQQADKGGAVKTDKGTGKERAGNGKTGKGNPGIKNDVTTASRIMITNLESPVQNLKPAVDVQDDFKKAVDTFKTRYPKTKVRSFSLTPVAGIYEAAVAKEVVYFDSTARFMFSGRLLDMDKGVDLTDKKLKELRRIDFKSLPLDRAVKTVYGKGTRKLAVFTDVDCPFSRKLSETLEGLTDTTVYTFLFPLESIHPQARGKSDAIWCAKDSSSALKATMKGQPIAMTVANNPLCDSPVDETLKLAQKHGIAGTPTLINEAGDRISGALPLDKLKAFVEGK